MKDTVTRIVDAIEAYVESFGGDWSRWYVGIASDVRDRLFSDHGVRECGDLWIYRPAPTSRIARDAEADLIRKHNAQGGTGGGGVKTRFVYAYRTASHTVE